MLYFFFFLQLEVDLEVIEGIFRNYPPILSSVPLFHQNHWTDCNQTLYTYILHAFFYRYQGASHLNIIKCNRNKNTQNIPDESSSYHLEH